MFICDKCLTKYNQNEGLFPAFGACKICGTQGICHEIADKRFVTSLVEIFKPIKIKEYSGADSSTSHQIGESLS
jgi:hypothetical protein